MVMASLREDPPGLVNENGFEPVTIGDHSEFCNTRVSIGGALG